MFLKILQYDERLKELAISHLRRIHDCCEEAEKQRMAHYGMGYAKASFTYNKEATAQELITTTAIAILRFQHYMAEAAEEIRMAHYGMGYTLQHFKEASIRSTYSPADFISIVKNWDRNTSSIR